MSLTAAKVKTLVIRNAFVFCGAMLLMTAYGCNSQTTALLESADRIMREQPDSALSIIESIDPDRLSDDGERAFYALLLTDARYRTDYNQTDDSIINIAASYYHLRESSPLRARAYYQKGMIHNNAGQYSSALLALMLAEETASALKDTLQLALIHRSMADTFGSMKNPKTAAEYYTKSYEEFASINDSVYLNDALYDIARANYNATAYRDAIEVLEKLLPKVETTANDRTLIPYVLNLMGAAYQDTENYEEAIRVLTRLHNEYPSEMRPQTWNNLGLSYLYSNNLEKARECEDSIKVITDEPSWLSYRIADVTGDYPKALSLLKVEYNDGNDFFIDWVSRSAEKDLLDQYARLKENSRRERRANAVILTLVIIILILSAVIAYLVIKRLHTRNQRLADDNARLSEDNVSLTGQREALTEQLHENKAAVRRLRENISRQDNEIIALRATLRSLNEERESLIREIELRTVQNIELRSRIREADSLLASREQAIAESRGRLKEAVASQAGLIDGMVRAYYGAESRKLPKNEVLDKFSEVVAGMHHENEILRQFEKSVNHHLDNLMADFRRDYPGLNDYEYDLFLLSVLGFSPKSISVFQDISTENFYNRKSKLIKKIRNTGDGISHERYLDFI